MTVYSYTDLSIQNAVYKFLYGTFDPINDLADHAERIREETSSGDSISVGLQAFMQDGPGRYIKPNNFSIVSAFFNDTIQLADGSYSLEALMNLNGFEGKSSAASIRTYPIDVTSADYDTRAFVWGTTGYSISNAIFSVQNGVRTIQSMEIVAGQENFDFTGGPGTSYINSILSEVVDPMKIGLTFFVNFVGQGSIFENYSASDYTSDADIFESLIYPESVWKSYLAVFEGTQFVLDTKADPLRGFIEDGRNVLYGDRAEDDVLDAHSPANNVGPDLLPVVLVGGGGDDTLIGSEWSDLLFGGTGDDAVYTGRLSEDGKEMDDTYADTVFAGNGDDVVYAGGGYDLISLGSGNDAVHFMGEGNRSVVWGGEGIDQYFFDSAAHVLLLDMPDLTEELFARLSPEMLFGIIDSGEYPYTHIVINAENQDEFYYNGIKLGEATVHTKTSVDDVETLHYLAEQDKQNPVIYHINLEYISAEHTEEFYRTFRQSNNENIAVLTSNISDAGYSLSFYNTDPQDPDVFGEAFALDGFVDGIGGIAVSGDDYSYEFFQRYIRYIHVIDEVKPEIVISDLGQIGYMNTVVKWHQVGVEYDESISDKLQKLKAEGYDTAQRYVVNASDYVIEIAEGDSNGGDFTGNAKAQKFKGGSGGVGVGNTGAGVDYSSSSKAISVDMKQGRGESGDARGDIYIGIKKIIGSNFNDSFYGGKTDNHFIGGAGDDWFSLVEAGSDIIEGGDGIDSVAFEGEVSNYSWSQNADGKVVASKGDGYSVTLGGIEHFSFSDGYMTLADVELLIDQTVTSTSADETLALGHGNDSYIYVRGAGDDIIVENATEGTSDRLVMSGFIFDDVEFTRLSDDLLITVPKSATEAGDGGSILVKNTLLDDDSGIENFVFEDWTYTKADMRSALLSQLTTTGDDVIEGFHNTGDYLEGGAGNDVFVFKPNFGWDTIGDFVAGAGTDDVLEFHGGVLVDFEAVLAAASQVGNDTIINVDGTNGITLANVNLADLHRDDVRFVA
ncbi:hypothetical protein AGR8A_pTi10150 [Agrobacterium fabrum str. J-07]|uniref:calcium-binding protein n=1 Tax=Agrobacterium fabrum TaxID=1176649 RepID=UPI0009BB0358|nr:calcium-binding protein [Agrobacterium fabrum]CUX57608.1 hypothetical protein AGR8A_pTi10150 [Agrobacterium fabrum str. J-07]